MISKMLTYLVLSTLSMSPLWWFAVSSSGEKINEMKGGSISGIKLGGCYFSDSEGFVHRCGHLWGEFCLTENRYVEADFTRHWVSQGGDQFSGSGITFFLRDRLGPGMEARLGMGLVDYEQIGSNLSYLASLGVQTTHTSHLTLSYEYYNVVDEVRTLDALKGDIDAYELSPSFYQSISERWSFWAGFNLGGYSDGNLKTSVNTSFTYLLRPDPEFSFSYAFGYLSYKNRSDCYWDPTHYLNHYLVVGLEEHVGGMLSFNLRGSIGYSPSERRTNSGLSIRLKLHHSPHWELGVTGEFLGDPGRSGNYSSSTTSVDIIYLP